MESSQIPMDIIVYAVIAGFLVVWLMRILGQKNGSEVQRPNPFAGGVPQESAENQKIVSLPGLTPSVDAGLVQIALADRNFDAARFIENAKDAFAIVVAAFAQGDRATLKDLLAEKVYKSFDGAITAREASGKTVVTEVVAVREADIIEAVLSGKHASVAVRFKADETYVETDAAGKVTAGHPERLVTMTDVWVFTRDTRSSDPRWFVSETRDDAREDNAPTLPEAKA
jgi:predicted lipid-binding transport protein (Tim44 family)